MKTVTISEDLAIAIAQILSQLPAGQVAKMLIALDDAIRLPTSQDDAARKESDAMREGIN